MIKLLIFDIGGVLIDFAETDYIRYLKVNALPKISERELEHFIMPLITLMELGSLSENRLEHMVSKHFGLKNVDLRWVEGFKKLAKPEIEVIELLNRLSEGYRVVLLSNVSNSRYDEIRESYLGRVKVKKVYASCFLHTRKPQPDIYRYVLKKEGVSAKEAIFVDNQIENVIGAEEVGIRSVWFRGYRQLVTDLKRDGVRF